MKRALPAILTASAVMMAFTVRAHAASKEHKVEVKVKEDRIGCLVAEPDCQDQIDDARRGDTVLFTFKNECRRAVSLHIGRFQPLYIGEADAGTPLEGPCLKGVSLKGGQSETLLCRVKERAVVNRTYKYSILSGKRVLLDPRIEIVP